MIGFVGVVTFDKSGTGAAFREPLHFIAIAVMSVIGGTFPHINRVFA